MTEERIYMDNTYMDVIKFGEGDKNLVVVAGASVTGIEGQGAVLAKAYELFSRKYTVYVLERKKDMPVGYHVTDMADDIYRVLRELGVDNADFIGASQGGCICIDLALEHPEMVNKLVLISSFCRSTPLMKANGLKWLELAKLRDIVKLNRFVNDVVYSKQMLEKVKDQLPVLESKGTDEDMERFEIIAKACTNVDFSGDIDMIRCPLFVIGDMNDKTVGPEGTQEIADLTGCKMFMYDEYGHAVYDEAPDIKQKIYDFLIKSKK